MNAAEVAHSRGELLWAVSLGVIATAVAILPGWELKAGVPALLVTTTVALWVVSAPLRWVPLFIAVAWLIPPLPFDFGSSGPHVAVLVAAIGLYAGFVRLPNWRFQIDAISASVLLFFGAICISLVFAFLYSGIAIGFASVVRVCLLGIAVYGFFYIRCGPGRMDGYERQIIVAVLFAGVLSAALACVDFYYQFPAPAGYGPQFIWLDTGVFRRAQGMFYEASTLGNMCAFVIELIVVALVLRPKALRVRSIVLVICAIPLLLALVLSYSRGSILNVVVAVTALLWLMRARIRFFRTAGMGVIMLSAGAALLGWVFPTFLNAYVLRVWASFQYFGEAPNAVLSGRLNTWTQLAGWIVEHPVQVLFGIGYKTLPYKGTSSIADNTYLSMLIETGMAGLIALFLLHIAILRASHRAYRSTHPMESFLGALFFCFWCGQMVQMLSADLLTYWRLLPVYLCVLALATKRNNPQVA